MEIEIITTKKKLTKSLVKQMHVASHSIISSAINPGGIGKVLGYVTDCHKLASRLAIIHHINDYYTVPMHKWGKSPFKGRITAKCDKSRGSVLHDFDTEKEVDDVLDSFRKLRHILVGGHIYL